MFDLIVSGGVAVTPASAEPELFPQASARTTTARAEAANTTSDARSLCTA